MFAPRPVVYFFSDFGSHGPYVGQVEAVIRHRTQAHFINLLSNAPAADPFRSAYLINALFTELPVKKGYMLAVVDPGVGSGRHVITFQIGKMTFLGPDNGLFSHLIRKHAVNKVAVLKYPSTKISASFHARDWFAPELARLINGESIDFKIIPASELVGMDWPESLDEVIYIDHYGNLVTGIPAAGIEKGMSVQIADATLSYAHTFSEVPIGELFWYENSMGLVEIAANSESAARRTGMTTGSKIVFVKDVQDKKLTTMGK